MSSCCFLSTQPSAGGNVVACDDDAHSSLPRSECHVFDGDRDSMCMKSSPIAVWVWYGEGYGDDDVDDDDDHSSSN